jgi:antitoxin (DNA-binding transcriptional repressor) of toxin-antitoxin stability system
VTKRGRPVARLVPSDDDGPIFSSVRVIDTDDDLASTGEHWSVDA